MDCLHPAIREVRAIACSILQVSEIFSSAWVTGWPRPSTLVPPWRCRKTSVCPWPSESPWGYSQLWLPIGPKRPTPRQVPLSPPSPEPMSSRRAHRPCTGKRDRLHPSGATTESGAWTIASAVWSPDWPTGCAPRGEPERRGMLPSKVARCTPLPGSLPRSVATAGSGATSPN